MGVLPIVLLILAMKVPILGLIWFTWWASRTPEEDEALTQEVVARPRPRQPEPPLLRGPRRRGPHGGGAARPLPARRAAPAACLAHAAEHEQRQHAGSA